jgi:hypothetical protein
VLKICFGSASRVRLRARHADISFRLLKNVSYFTLLLRRLAYCYAIEATLVPPRALPELGEDRLGTDSWQG